MKKLFQGVKTDMTFKAAGPGRRLNEEKRGNPDILSKEQPRPPKPSPKEAQIAAASAAMARVESMQGKGRLQYKNVNKIHVLFIPGYLPPVHLFGDCEIACVTKDPAIFVSMKIPPTFLMKHIQLRNTSKTGPTVDYTFNT